MCRYAPISAVTIPMKMNDAEKSDMPVIVAPLSPPKFTVASCGIEVLPAPIIIKIIPIINKSKPNFI